MLKLFVFQLSFPHRLVCCCFHNTTCYISKISFALSQYKNLRFVLENILLPFEPVQGSKTKKKEEKFGYVINEISKRS